MASPAQIFLQNQANAGYTAFPVEQRQELAATFGGTPSAAAPSGAYSRAFNVAPIAGTYAFGFWANSKSDHAFPSFGVALPRTSRAMRRLLRW